MGIVIVLVIAALVAVNALYVAAEFAAVSVRRTRIAQLARDGNAAAQRLLPTLQEPARLDRYIAACQIGITLSSLVLGAYGQATIPGIIAPAFERLGGLREAAAQSVSAVVVLVMLTAFQMVLGELVPKSLALQYPTRVALLTHLPMRWSLAAYRVFIVVLNGSGLAVLRLLRARGAGHAHTHSPDEIELLIVQSSDGGLLEPEERARLRKALQISKRSAQDIMIPRRQVFAVDIDEPVDQIVRAVTLSPYTRVPAYRETTDNIVGILHTKDLVLARTRGAPVTDLRPFLRPALSIPESMRVDQLLATLRRERARQAIVVDEYGGVAGLVTMEDVLAEFFGEFGDEFKIAAAEPYRLEDGRLRVPGAMSADAAAALIGIQFEGTSATVGGQVIEALGELASGGETVTIGGAEFTVDEVSHHAISWLTVRPPQPPEPEAEPESVGEAVD